MENPMKAMILVTVAVMAGCATTTPVPADKLSRSQAAVRSAEEMNAASEPRAALHLKLAKEQLAQAKDFMKEGDNERAKAVLLRAESDGEAALALARARSAHAETQKALDTIQEIKAQIQAGGSKS